MIQMCPAIWAATNANARKMRTDSIETTPLCILGHHSVQVILKLRREGVGYRNQESRGSVSSDHSTHESEQNGRSDGDDDDDDELRHGENNNDRADAEVHGNGGVGVEDVPRATLDVEAIFGAQQSRAARGRDAERQQ